MGVKDRSFWRGASRGFEKTFAPSMNNVMESELARNLFKKNAQLKNIMQEEEDRKESAALQKRLILDSDWTTEEKLPFMEQFGDGKTPLSREQRERIEQDAQQFKSTKSAKATAAAEAERIKAAEEAAIQDEWESQIARLQALPEDERSKRFGHYLKVEKPTRGRIEALKSDIGLYVDESKAGRRFENQLKLKEVGAANKGGGSDSTPSADRPKSSKELLDKAYQDYRASMKDADELEMIAKLVGSDTPAGAKRSFREYLLDWLPNAGRVFNADVADSMESALKGAPSAERLATGLGVSSVKAPDSTGAQVPAELVERAMRALESIERQIQEFEARK